jgi:hypothetical protein
MGWGELTWIGFSLVQAENFEISTLRLKAGCSSSELYLQKMFIGVTRGIEPSLFASQANLLPLHYGQHKKTGLSGQIRTDAHFTWLDLQTSAFDRLATLRK